MRTSRGISLDFMNIYLYPKSYSKTLTPITCIVKDSFATIFHKNCSYFIHRQSCFLLSKRVVTQKDAFCDKISAHSSFHLQLQQKFLVHSRTEEIMPPVSLNNFQAFLKPVTLFIRTWDIRQELRVYNCCCFQPANQSDPTLRLLLWQCTKCF